MPSLPASLNTARSVFNNAFISITRQFGDEGALFRDQAEVTLDWRNSYTVLRVNIEFARRVIWTRDFRVHRGDGVEISTENMAKEFTSAMQATLDLSAEMHHARLLKHFPKAIRQVKMEYNVETCQKVVCVQFMNGHVAKAPEHEAKTDLFVARCGMLYDLPHL